MDDDGPLRRVVVSVAVYAVALRCARASRNLYHRCCCGLLQCFLFAGTCFARMADFDFYLPACFCFSTDSCCVWAPLLGRCLAWASSGLLRFSWRQSSYLGFLLSRHLVPRCGLRFHRGLEQSALQLQCLFALVPTCFCLSASLSLLGELASL